MTGLVDHMVVGGWGGSVEMVVEIWGCTVFHLPTPQSHHGVGPYSQGARTPKPRRITAELRRPLWPHSRPFSVDSQPSWLDRGRGLSHSRPLGLRQAGWAQGTAGGGPWGPRREQPWHRAGWRKAGRERHPGLRVHSLRGQLRPRDRPFPAPLSPSF